MKATAKMILAVMVAISVGMPPVHAQTELGTAFKKAYRLRTVQCVACHVKSESGDDEKEEEEAEKEDHKKPLNEFGTTLQKLLEGRNVSERLKAAKKAGKEEKEKVVKEVCEEFTKSLEKLNTMNAPSGENYKALISSGKMPGTKARGN